MDLIIIRYKQEMQITLQNIKIRKCAQKAKYE